MEVVCGHKLVKVTAAGARSYVINLAHVAQKLHLTKAQAPKVPDKSVAEMLRAVATAAPAVPAQTIATPSAQAGSLVDQTPAPGQTPVTQTCHVEGLPLGLTTPPLVPLTVPVAAVMQLAPPPRATEGMVGMEVRHGALRRTPSIP